MDSWQALMELIMAGLWVIGPGARRISTCFLYDQSKNERKGEGEGWLGVPHRPGWCLVILDGVGAYESFEKGPTPYFLEKELLMGPTRSMETLTNLFPNLILIGQR